MNLRSQARVQQFTIIGQDPNVKDPRTGEILTAKVDVPAEQLDPGPWGHRVQVLDYDCTTGQWTDPSAYTVVDGRAVDPFAGLPPAELVRQPAFRAQNAYAIVMRTLARFERALGRRLSWVRGSHQLKVVPHAFCAANAYYTRDNEALLFGYFPGRSGQTIYTCLSHDVVVHETAHALLDALRERFVDPSSPDQAAFHEGFADIVALLSVFAVPEVVQAALQHKAPGGIPRAAAATEAGLADWLSRSALGSLAEEMGEEITQVRGAALRRSLDLGVLPTYYRDPRSHPEFLLPHRRGEILVAAVMRAFTAAWAGKLKASEEAGVPVNRDTPHLAEEGADAAEYLLTMTIRALDYMPPVHIEFPDFLNALITADLELHPDDSRYCLREHLHKSFAAFGICPEPGSAVPKGHKTERSQGGWEPIGNRKLVYERNYREPLTHEPDDVFRFLWENRHTLRLQGTLNDAAYLKVLSVRPCVRIAPDGFVLNETVAQFYQVARLTGRELRHLRFKLPDDLPPDRVVALYGGGTLIFDDYGRLKYYVHNSLDNVRRQSARIAELWSRDALPSRDTRLTGEQRPVSFADAHRLRSAQRSNPLEEW